MSDHFLVVIPADPLASLPERSEELRMTLAGIAGHDEARVKDYGKLQFIDAGGNWDGVFCPSCEAEISTSDWQAMMDRAWHDEDGFKLVENETPCCGAAASVADLNYKWPMGFARWFVSARNVGRGPLTDKEVARLEAIAGTRLTAIAQRY